MSLLAKPITNMTYEFYLKGHFVVESLCTISLLTKPINAWVATDATEELQAEYDKGNGLC